MKDYLIIQLLFLCTIAPAMAQYYSVNYDTRTVAEMSAAFGTEAATEAYYAQQIVFHFQILHFCFCFEIKYMLSLVHLLCKG